MHEVLLYLLQKSSSPDFHHSSHYLTVTGFPVCRVEQASPACSFVLPYLKQTLPLSTLAGRSLFEELAYHYELDVPDFSRIPIGNTSSSPRSSSTSSENSVPPEVTQASNPPQNQHQSDSLTRPQNFIPPEVTQGSTPTSSEVDSTPSSDQSEEPPPGDTLAIMTTPTFAFCGKFTGKTISAARWLKAYDRELTPRRESGQLTPESYLEDLDLLLAEDAAEWAESNSEAIRLLNTENPTQATVDQFTSLFKQRFPVKVAEVAPLTFDTEIADLRQQPNETVTSYFTRTTSLMYKYGAKDRNATTILSLAESSLLDTFLRTWIRGLSDVSVKRKCAESMGNPDRSMRMLYDVAEATRRINAEMQKLFEEESKENELQFYKDIAQRNMPGTQIDALRASYQASKAPQNSSQYQQWSFHTDPPQQVPEAPRSQSVPANPQSNPQAYRPPPYQSEAPPVLVQNPSRGNAGRNGNPNPPAGNRFRQQQSKDLPERSASKNPWINGTLHYSHGKDGLLCVKCGTKGHMASNCKAMPLPAWEQSYLRMIVFGDNPQVNFASVGFGEFDGAVRPYGTEQNPSTASTSSSASSGQVTPSTSSIDSYISPRTNSVQFGVAGLTTPPRAHATDAKAFRAHSGVFLGEGSGPNKRAHVEDEAESSQQASQSRREKQPEERFPPAPQQSQQLPQNAVPVPQQQPPPQQQGPTPQGIPTPAQSYQPPATTEEGRPKRRGRKRVGKKAEPQPLVGMFNGVQYDSPVSVRQVLQNTKVDMTWMDLVAWSPAVCKELKRLCTRVPKKRLSRPTDTTSQVPVPPAQVPQQAVPQPVVPQQPQQFAYQPMQQFPQPVPVNAMPQQLFQPMMTGAVQEPHTGLNVPGTLPQQSSSISSFNVGAAVMEAERHTRFLSSLVGVDKAFRVPSIVRKPDGSEIKVEKRQTQADQGSDMNVISIGMVRSLGLATHSLAEIGFKGLSMRTADQRDTVLEYWIWLNIGVEGIWRDIRCFVAPEVVSVTESGRSEYLSLILGIPWLYSVDASISIRLSTIFIGDRSIGEQVRGVVGPELVFCKDHNLLMYPKSAMVASRAPKPLPKAIVEELDSSDSSESSSEDEASDVEEAQQDFQ